jgi:hypothetical protein
MKLYLAFILLFTFHNTNGEKEVPGKYAGYFLGKQELIIKDNGKFVRRGYSLVPKDRELIPLPGNMPSPIVNTKKSRFKSKGNWVYFKNENTEGILLKTANHTDSLYLLKNGNLSPNNPNANERITTVINEKDTLFAIKNRGVIKEPSEFIKQ